MLAALLLLASLAQDPAGIKEPVLRAELLKRMKAEQDVRLDFVKLNPANKPITPVDREKPEIKAVFEKIEKIDKENLAWFKGVVKAKGWPGKSMVGPDGAQGAFLIAQHAASDLDFMAECHKLLVEAHKAGDAEGQWVALMTDRLLILKDKKKQRYGTQLESRDGKMVPQPIEDEAHVDERRKELGMRPLADYLKVVNESRGARAKPKDAPKAPKQ
ncbi:MAG: hypothetical protein JWN86_231 [Planctomycetota bacterium]|nr:hypothetical protein [Planctomycetota bacterium]